jgi:hypothetical protein
MFGSTKNQRQSRIPGYQTHDIHFYIHHLDDDVHLYHDDYVHGFPYICPSYTHHFQDND